MQILNSTTNIVDSYFIAMPIFKLRFAFKSKFTFNPFTVSRMIGISRLVFIIHIRSMNAVRIDLEIEFVPEYE